MEYYTCTEDFVMASGETAFFKNKTYEADSELNFKSELTWNAVHKMSKQCLENGLFKKINPTDYNEWCIELHPDSDTSRSQMRFLLSLLEVNGFRWCSGDLPTKLDYPETRTLTVDMEHKRLSYSAAPHKEFRDRKRAVKNSIIVSYDLFLKLYNTKQSADNVNVVNNAPGAYTILREQFREIYEASKSTRYKAMLIKIAEKSNPLLSTLQVQASDVTMILDAADESQKELISKHFKIPYIKKDRTGNLKIGEYMEIKHDGKTHIVLQTHLGLVSITNPMYTWGKEGRPNGGVDFEGKKIDVKIIAK